MHHSVFSKGLTLFAAILCIGSSGCENQKEAEIVRMNAPADYPGLVCDKYRIQVQVSPDEPKLYDLGLTKK